MIAYDKETCLVLDSLDRTVGQLLALSWDATSIVARVLAHLHGQEPPVDLKAADDQSGYYASHPYGITDEDEVEGSGGGGGGAHRRQERGGN